jgi:hypothetical protein
MAGHERTTEPEQLVAVRKLRSLFRSEGHQFSDLVPVAYLSDDEIRGEGFSDALVAATADRVIAEARRDTARAALMASARAHARQIGRGSKSAQAVYDRFVASHLPPVEDGIFEWRACLDALVSIVPDDADDATVLAALTVLRRECAKLALRPVEMLGLNVPGVRAFWLRRFQQKTKLDDERRLAVRMVVEAGAYRAAAEAVTAEITAHVQPTADMVPWSTFEEAATKRLGGHSEQYCIATGTPYDTVRKWRITGFAPQSALDSLAGLKPMPRKGFSSWTAQEVSDLIDMLKGGMSHPQAAVACTAKFGLGVTETDVRKLARTNWTAEEKAAIRRMRLDEGLGPTEIHQRFCREFREVTLNSIKGKMNHLKVWKPADE